MQQSVFYSKNTHSTAGPGVSNHIRGIVSSGRNIDREGYQRLLNTRSGSNSADYNNRKLPNKGKIIGICNIELIGTCHGLFIGGDILEAGLRRKLDGERRSRRRRQI